MRNIPSGCGDNSSEVVGAVKHGNGEDERSDKANPNRAHEGSRDDHSSVLAFFCQMYGAINTCIHVVWRHKAGQESDTIRPATLVDEVLEDDFRWLKSGSSPCQAGNDDNQKASDGDNDCAVSIGGTYDKGL